MSNLMSYLFETSAVKVCPDNKPFWYTSGKIGPYFINTHFIYGNEKDATELLDFIDEEKNNPIEMPKKILDKVLYQYETNEIYKDVVNEMKTYIEDHINMDEVDYISGGERRDWYFSNIMAYLLEKPHISIFKDLSTVVSTSDFSKSTIETSLNDKRVLHIADLITEASSYVRAWIPAIQNLGAEIIWSTVVVDRMQGGTKRLQDLGIQAYSMVQIDSSLFNIALEKGIINESQLEMLNKFIEDPDSTMREFLIAHPEFLENALNADEKTAQRAKLCIDNNLYDL